MTDVDSSGQLGTSVEGHGNHWYVESMEQTTVGKSRPSGMRIVLYVLAGVLTAVGVVLAVAMQSLVPIVCVVLGLALPLVPLGNRRH